MAGYDLTANNGILAQVPGDELAEASRLLPMAGPGLAEHMVVGFDSPRHGLIRITYQLMKNPRRQFKNWFWVASHAEIATSQGKVAE